MTTRRQLLGSASAAAAALALPGRARAASPDRDLLELLAAYTSTVVVAYEQAPRGRTLDRFKADVTQMDDVLRQAVAKRGGSPPPQRPVAASPSAARVALRRVVASEEALESAWFAALQKLVDRHLLEAAIGYMAAGGRRLVVVRKLAGLPLLPRAFETGSFP